MSLKKTDLDTKKNKKGLEIEKKQEKQTTLRIDEIKFMQSYGRTPYSINIKKLEKNLKKKVEEIDKACGIQESDKGLAHPAQWDFQGDQRVLSQEQPLKVAICTKILKNDYKKTNQYMVTIRQMAKYVVDLGSRVTKEDIEEDMRVAVDRNKYKIQIPLPPRIDPTVTMMMVEEKPDVTYEDVGGCKDQIQQLKEVVEYPLLNRERFVVLNIDPPKGILMFGPPGTGKTLCARAVANRTDACFIRILGSELVQRYVGEGARMVRELFQLARTKKACIIFFDEIDSIGGARYNDENGADTEVQRTMLEIINQLDGFDARGNIKVLMATNRPDTLDPALIRPGRIDRRIEFAPPDLEGRAKIFKIHANKMNCVANIRYDLLARLCINCTGAEIRSVCTEAGMFAIRERKKTVTEKHMLDAINKVIKEYKRFSSTSKYMVYN